MTSSIFQHLLKFKSVSKLTPVLFRQCSSPISTQSFNNNVYNALLLKDIDSTCSDIDCDYTATHHTVMELLGCSPKEAIDLIELDPDILRLPAANLIEVKKLCRKNKIPVHVLKRNLAWMTKMRPVELDHRFLYYWKWSFRNQYERPEILRLLSLNLTTLTTLTCRAMREESQISHGNRISYFADKLQTSVTDSTDLIIKYPFLMRRNLSRLCDIIDQLLDAGVSPKDIFKDPWPMLYNESQIQSRLKTLEECGIRKIKPWMTRCKESRFWRCIEIRQLAQEVSQQFDTKDRYLCERLNATPTQLNECKVKYPRLAQVSLLKLKTMLDLLLHADIDPMDILKYPQVLTFSPETMEMRLNKLAAAGIKFYQMSMLSAKNKKFEAYLKMMDSVTQISLRNKSTK